MENYQQALNRFQRIITSQLERIQRMKDTQDFMDYKNMDSIVIGIVGGDGIGPFITAHGQKVIEILLEKEIKEGKIKIKKIEGLTLANRLVAEQAIPDSVLEELQSCHVLLKGPTETPRMGDGTKNIESANVKMRKELDLFANVRPVKVDALGIDWVFFRENTEGAYALGSQGFAINPDLSVDFTVTTTLGSERIIKAAFDYAVKNGKTKVTAVTKANVIKETDGKFLKIFKEIAKNYPDITIDDWYIDIMTAKLIDEKRRKEFQVMVLPNLYGDILTDEAAEIQGGVGTCGSANIGSRYAMFEAIHGSAPRMVNEGRGDYADPRSIIKAAGMLISHIGYWEESQKLEEAMKVLEDKEKINFTGREGGMTGKIYGELLAQFLLYH